VTPLAVYGAVLRRAAAGSQAGVALVDAEGESLAWLDASLWVGELIPGDDGLLERCTGPVLDVGCGPGRLTAALRRAGVAALGVDVSPEAVRQAHRRGATALRADVFDPLPAEGEWRSILLADGNIGIGGDPARLLRRCAGLLDRAGTVLAELRPPGERGWRANVALRDATRQSTAFPWASVAAHEIRDVAGRAAFDVGRLWTEAGRWFAQLTVHGSGP
jgi:SAM-dependent methyltransferase